MNKLEFTRNSEITYPLYIFFLNGRQVPGDYNQENVYKIIEEIVCPLLSVDIVKELDREFETDKNIQLTIEMRNYYCNCPQKEIADFIKSFK